MIRPPGFRGAAFGAAADGDARKSEAARQRLSARIGIAAEWAYPTQVHGACVLEAAVAGHLGEADAVYTTHAGLPIAVATADCVPVILEGPDVVAVVHAGWRGAVAGVIPAALGAIDRAGCAIEQAAIGPSIGPCCYEVGDDVARLFPGYVGVTRAGTTSIDIASYLEAQLDHLQVWRSNVCTCHSATHHSYRRSRTTERQVAVGWIPPE